MKGRWFQGLKSATPGERWSLLEAEIKAERLFVQEIVGVLCALSPSGLTDCRDLHATCRIRRWSRNGASLFSTIKCTANRPGASREYRWRLHRVPGTRACRPTTKNG